VLKGLQVERLAEAERLDGRNPGCLERFVRLKHSASTLHDPSDDPLSSAQRLIPPFLVLPDEIPHGYQKNQEGLK
jgi:hypothetical protein